jgi:hypothetical protein
MRGLRRTVLAAVTVAACATPVAAAAAGPRDHEGGGAVVAPVQRLAGTSAADLLAQWWSQMLAIPAAVNPLESPTTPGVCLSLGRGEKVVSADWQGPWTCTVKAGAPVLIVGPGAECSSAEPAPFHGDTEAQQRACAIEQLTAFSVVSSVITVDGGPPVDIANARFLVTSSQGTTVYARDAVFGAAPGPATFVAYGWEAALRGLRPGSHTVVIRNATAGGQTFGGAPLTLIVVGDD